MIIELGHFAAISAFVLLCFQSVSAWYAAASQSTIYLAFSRRCLKVGAVLFLLSYMALWYGFMSDEFSLLVVATYSSATLPWLFKSAALWSTHSGGLMLWLMALYGVMYRMATNRAPFTIELVAYMQAVSSFFALTLLGVLLFYLNPFLRTLPIYPDVGRDLTPVLQHGYLLLHVPLVYAAYAVLAVPYFYVAAQLLQGRVDWRGLSWLQPWLYGGWVVLTFAFAIGIAFANHRLGWGLWWDWDPVENMVLLMWLLETALLHAVCYAKQHRGFLLLMVMLSIAIFLLCLASSFLIHSDMLTTTHHFSLDGPAALPFLGVLAANGGCIMGLYVCRKSIFHVSDPWVAYSTTHVMLQGIILLIMMAITMACAILYPIWVGVFSEKPYWIGSPYYVRMLSGWCVPLLGLMLWIMIKADSFRSHWMTLAYGVLVVAVLLLTGWFWPYALGWGYLFFVLLLASGLAFMLAVGSKVYQQGWRYLLESGAMVSSHMGVWLLILGLYAHFMFTQSGEVVLPVGESVDIGGVTITAERSYHKRGDNYVSEVLDIHVDNPQGANRHVHPEIRTYDVSKDTVSEAVNERFGCYDLRLALSRHHQSGRSILWFWTPYAFLIRAGGMFLLIGVVWAAYMSWYRRFTSMRASSCT